MKNWTPEAIKAWTAGIIDGEGSVSLVLSRRPNRKRDTIGVRIRVVNTDKEMTDLLQLTWGGSVHVAKERTSKHKRAYYWDVGGNGMLRLLEAVKPYLITKEKRAELVIKYQELINARLHNNYFPPLTEDEYQVRLELYKEMKRLNKRG